MTMEFALDKALRELTIEEDKPIILKKHLKYSSCERNVCSLIGRLLNPEKQKMSSMIHDMSRLWRVYNRTRGIALSKDRFQFIFYQERDLQMVLDAGAWTYDDWSMVLERWVENPPEDYLQILPIWLKLRYIPVNYYTLETIEDIADNIGQVTYIAFDPLKPQSRGFVRVWVLFDVSKLLWNTKTLQIQGEEDVSIGVEYERVRKRCFRCKKITHDIDNCPLNPANRQLIATGGLKGTSVGLGFKVPKISKDDPLFGVLTDADVGLYPKTRRPKIAKAVLDEMRQYLSVADMTERNARVIRVRKSVWDLEDDPQGQKTLLRLEPATKVTQNLDKGKGLTFDFETTEEQVHQGEKLMASVIRAGSAVVRESKQSLRHSSSSNNNVFLSTDSTVFRVGSVGSSRISTKHNKKRRCPNQWRRKDQRKDIRQGSQTEQEKINKEGTWVPKRKDTEDSSNSSKVAKRIEEVVVLEKELLHD